MAQKAMFDYHKLTPHELKLLDLMEERHLWTIFEFISKLLEQGNSLRRWTIFEFRSKLLEQGRSLRRSFKMTKAEDQYRDFLKQRSNLFGMY